MLFDTQDFDRFELLLLLLDSRPFYRDPFSPAQLDLLEYTFAPVIPTKQIAPEPATVRNMLLLSSLKLLAAAQSVQAGVKKMIRGSREY